MSSYFINVIDTNRFGGPFSNLWQVQQYVNSHELPNGWEFGRKNRQSSFFDHEEAKERIDNDEIDVPCGERAFSEDEAETLIVFDEQLGVFEVTLWAECTECGFEHQVSEHMNPEP
jgi:hypothetical protein